MANFYMVVDDELYDLLKHLKDKNRLLAGDRLTITSTVRYMLTYALHMLNEESKSIVDVVNILHKYEHSYTNKEYLQLPIVDYILFEKIQVPCEEYYYFKDGVLEKRNTYETD